MRHAFLHVFPAILPLTITACSGHDYTFSYGFMVGFTCGALITAIVVLALDRGES